MLNANIANETLILGSRNDDHIVAVVNRTVVHLIAAGKLLRSSLPLVDSSSEFV